MNINTNKQINLMKTHSKSIRTLLEKIDTRKSKVWMANGYKRDILKMLIDLDYKIEDFRKYYFKGEGNELE